MALHPVVEQVTNRIIARSKRSRAAYLEHLEAARIKGVCEGTLTASLTVLRMPAACKAAAESRLDGKLYELDTTALAASMKSAPNGEFFLTGPITIEPGLIIGVVLSVWIFSLLAGLLSIRRIARIDPASAVGAR